jgi:hypothetical protein
LGDDSLSTPIAASDGTGAHAGAGILGVVPAARRICFRVCNRRTEIQLRSSAAELFHGTGCATKIVKTLICAALAAAAAEVVATAKSGLAGARVRRAARIAFSIRMPLTGALEMSLAAALAVTRSFAWSSQESRVRREQTHTEEKTKDSPPRPRVSKQLGNRVEPLSVHSRALHRDVMLSAMSPEADSPD